MAKLSDRIEDSIQEAMGRYLHSGGFSLSTAMGDYFVGDLPLPEFLTNVLRDMIAIKRCKDKMEKQEKLNTLRGCL